MAVVSVEAGSDTLQDAYDDASDGDVLELADGTYTSTQNPLLSITDRNITIRALNLGQAILKGYGRRVIDVGSWAGLSGGTVVLHGLHITKGRGINAANAVSAFIWNLPQLPSVAPLEFLCVHNPSHLLFQGGGIRIYGTSTVVTISYCDIYSNNASGSVRRTGFEFETIP